MNAQLFSFSTVGKFNIILAVLIHGNSHFTLQSVTSHTILTKWNHVARFAFPTIFASVLCEAARQFGVAILAWRRIIGEKFR